jgi:hypothetical protein
MDKEKNNFWIVEFNETDEKIKNFANEIVTPELIDKIKILDKQFSLKEKWSYKFYFDHIINNKTVEHIRIDIGEDDLENNNFFNYLRKDIEKNLLLENKEEKLIKKEKNTNKTLYEYFDVKDKFELYKLLKNNDERVKELKEFIKYSKRKVERNLKKINSPQIFANYTLNEFLPNKNEIFISGVDTHLNLVSRTKIDLNKKIDMKEVFKELNTKSLSGVLIAYNSIDNTEIMELRAKNLKDMFNNLDFKVRDFIKINNEFVVNEMYDEYPIKIQNDFEKTYEKYLKNIKDKEPFKKENQEFLKDLTAFKFYDEFINYYIKQENIGLNYFLNEDKILESLRLPYQYLEYEKMGLIALDENYNISSIKEYSSGGQNSAIIPFNRIMKDVFDSKDSSYIMYHNHPSGNLIQSQEDELVTEKLLDALAIFDKKLIGSVVLSDEGFNKIPEVVLNNHYNYCLNETLKNLKIDERIKLKNIDELTSFKDYEKIEKIDIQNNSLEDIQHLIKFKNLKEINLINNPIRTLKNFEIIKSLEQKGIKFNLDFEQKNRLDFVKKEKIKSKELKTKKNEKIIER